jgi:hypothetical protein
MVFLSTVFALKYPKAPPVTLLTGFVGAAADWLIV